MLIVVDMALPPGEITSTVGVCHNEARSKRVSEQIDEIKLRAGALLGQAKQLAFIITCECADSLSGDLLGITQHEHYR
jgi:hypothetical protein